jgi:D-alanyl-lipoteichoic acid acyltransferase DltB (MBOAT superfamily)
MVSLVANLGTLFVFKYFNFFIDSAREWLSVVGITVPPMVLELVLPIGISFYTFQTLSYTIDVYRGQVKPERHLGYFALYVSFFPQLVAGPIERARTLMPQFRKRVQLTLPDVQEAMNLIAYGFFKKLVVADRLAVYVSKVFTDTAEMEPLSILFGCVFFCVQVYCDFSGYSDIAIGTARLFGIRLMDNFNRPYLARSLREFWRRWHMSLSQWIRDYVYIPLGGSRIGKVRTVVNLFITFILVGLWHGGYWALVVWGAAHALGVAIERLFIGVKVNIPRAIIDTLGRIWTLSFVALTFIVYAARDLEQAITGLSSLFGGAWSFSRQSMLAGVKYQDFQLCLLAVLLLALSYAFPLKPRFTGSRSRARNMLYFLIFTVCTVILSTNEQIEFFYFQF